MTTERTTKEIVTPNGHKVVIYDYITGGESRKVTAVYMEGLSTGKVRDSVQSIMDQVPLTSVYKAQELALSILIRSVDGGEQATAYEDAMNLKEEDLSKVMEEIDSITTGTLKKNVESSQSTSQGEQ